MKKLTKLQRVQLVVMGIVLFVVILMTAIWRIQLEQFVLIATDPMSWLSSTLGIGFYGIIGATSSKQMMRVSIEIDNDHTDFASSATNLLTQEYIPILDVYVQKVRTSVTTTIGFDNPVFIATEVTPDKVSDVVFDSSYDLGDLLDEIRTGDTGVSMIRDTRASLFYIGDEDVISESVNVQETELMYPLMKGESVTLYVEAVDKSAAPTAGAFLIQMTLYLIVLSYNRSASKPKRNHEPFLYVFGSNTTNQTLKWTYLPPVDCRLYSIEIQMMGLIDNYDMFAFLNEEYDVGDLVNTSIDTLSELADNRKIPLIYNDPSWNTNMGDTTAGGFQQIVRFLKGPVFLRKSDPVTVLSHNSGASNSVYFYMTAQMMPDYKNQVDFNVSFVQTASAASHRQYFRIPFDLYVSQIEVDVTWRDGTGTPDGWIDIYGIKDGDFTFGNANDHGMLKQTGLNSEILHPAILDRIYLVSPETSGTKSSVSFPRDYYPAGSHIAIDMQYLQEIDDASGLQVTLNIDAFNPRKYSSKYSRRKMTEGTFIMRFEGAGAV